MRLRLAIAVHRIRLAALRTTRMSPRTAKSSRPKRTTEEVVVPDKLYFRIGEVAQLAGVPAYVLRFWETEFPHIKATKGSTGQRNYRRKDVENVLRIKKLLHEDGFTIAGARQLLKAEAKKNGNQAALPFANGNGNSRELRAIRNGLREVVAILSAKR